MKCSHCPISSGGACEGERVPRLCQLVDPTHPDHNDGYAALLRKRAGEPDPPRETPGLVARAVNFGRALVRHARNGFARVDEPTRQARMAECSACEHNDEGACRLCGCLVALKTQWASERCPMEPPKWADVVVRDEGCPTCP